MTSPDSIKARLETDLKHALRSKEALRLSTIRMIKAEVVNKEKEHGQPADDATIISLLYGMLKRREEAAVAYEQGRRADRAAQERAEADIIRGYLPPQLDEASLRREALAAIQEVGATSRKEIGKVMGLLARKLAGQASGAAISQAVRAELEKIEQGGS